jgi:hypothetical protein
LDMFEYVLIVDKGRIIEEGPRSVILSKYIWNYIIIIICWEILINQKDGVPC